MECYVSVVILMVLLPASAQVLCPDRCFCIETRVICSFSNPRHETVPPNIHPNTTVLDLSNNLIQFLDSSSFAGLTQLHTLFLRNNQIKLISAYTFTDLHNLVVLNLGGNRIQDIQPYTFRSLSQLDELYLTDNLMVQLREHSFYGMTSLKVMYLDDNNLQDIPEESMKPLMSLSILDLEGNDIQCGCSTAWMRDFAPLESSTATCIGPTALVGVPVNEIPLEHLDCLPPTVSTTEGIVEAFKGDTVALHCMASGDPNPMLHWEFDGRVLSDSIHYRVYPNGSLVIVSMVDGLDGEYCCVAVNVMGNDSSSVLVEYQGARLPQFHRTPADVHVFIGESFMLQCRGDQVTEEYVWMKDRMELEPSERVQIDPGVGLMVLEATRDDSGVYRCVIMNEEGERVASAVVNVTGALLTCDGVITSETVDEMRENVDMAFNATQLELETHTSSSPSMLLHRLRFPENGSIELVKAAEVFQQAIDMATFDGNTSAGGVDMLTPCELTVLAELSGCMAHLEIPDCSENICFHQQYRTYDGNCNNLDQPRWGAANTPFQRLLEPDYEDGLGKPLGWSGGEERPSARLISTSLIAAKHVQPNENYTHMLMQFGQFLDHDIDRTPGSGSDVEFTSGESCGCENEAPCFPIPVPEDDPRITKECIPFTRSSAVCGSGAPSLLVGKAAVRREQINAITAFLDASHIYGSSNYTATRLRESGSGLLLRGLMSSSSQHFLPFDEHSLLECETGPVEGENRSKCFLAGDVRANEQVGLTSMHTIFYREHNRVASILATLNPHWDGERVFQETRRVVIAEWQNIVFTEYLPKILGSTGMYMVGDYEGYDPSVDASVANAFATAAYRFGHSQIMPLFPRLDADYQPLSIGPLKLQDAFFAPYRLLEEGGVDPLIRGLIASPVKLRISSQGLNSNLTEALFAQAHQVALDLAALNMQRGRDHGLPDYNKWRAYCGLSVAHTMEGLRREIDNSSVRELLQTVYGSDPGSVDLWVGGLLEDVVQGSQLGPTFLCIIADQFSRLRSGDRFWYERTGVFSPDQLVQLRQSSLSRIICDNADNITRVPRDVFVLQKPSQFAPCHSIPKVDLSTWKDCTESCDEGGVRVERTALFAHDSTYIQQLQERLQDLEDQMKAMHNS